MADPEKMHSLVVRLIKHKALNQVKATKSPIEPQALNHNRVSGHKGTLEQFCLGETRIGPPCFDLTRRTPNPALPLTQTPKAQTSDPKPQTNLKKPTQNPKLQLKKSKSKESLETTDKKRALH